MAKKHLRNVAKELCSELKKNGFNGMRFDNVSVSTSDEEYEPGGEMNKKEYAQYICNYASFILEYDKPYFEIDDSEYSTSHFDERKFLADLMKFIESKVGPGVTINYRPGCFEYEIYRDKEMKKVLASIHGKELV